MLIFLRKHWKSITWALVLLLLSTIPDSQFPESKLFSLPHFDKFVHLFLYFVFTILLISGNNAHRLRRRVTVSAIVCAAFISLPFGIAMEVVQLQLVPSRSAEVYDLAANVAGFLLALIAYRPANRITDGFI